MAKKLTALIPDYKERGYLIARDSAFELGNRVQDGTPVDTGRARQAWEGSGGFAQGQVYEFLNNVPYIRRLEYDAHSPQARKGFLRINVRNWDSIVKQMARKYK